MDRNIDAEKRRLTAALGRTAGMSALVATHWGKPVISAIVTPAHAQTSPFVAASCGFSERHTDRIALRDAVWADSMFVPQYDPSNGPLARVEVRWSGVVNSTIRVENQEAQEEGEPLDEVELSATVGAAMSLAGPGGLDLGGIAPTVIKSATVTDFDGVLDFGGTSGVTFDDVNLESEPQTIEYTDPDTLALFVGNGAVEFKGVSNGQTQVFGSVNITNNIQTQSGMRLSVTYTCVE